MSSIPTHVFKHPFCCLIAGPSQSGKSTLLSNILHNKDTLITPHINRIIYCYARWNPGFDKLKFTIPNIEFQEGLPNVDEISANQNNLLVLDDLMTKAEQNKEINEIFTTDSHHKNISCFIITQNLFSQGKYARSISLNCQYLIILNNPRDRGQIFHIARQMYPTNPNFLVECYEDATSKQYGYLLIDMSQSTANQFRVQTGITPTEQRIIYQIKN